MKNALYVYLGKASIFIKYIHLYGLVQLQNTQVAGIFIFILWVKKLMLHWVMSVSQLVLMEPGLESLSATSTSRAVSAAVSCSACIQNWMMGGLDIWLWGKAEMVALYLIAIRLASCGFWENVWCQETWLPRPNIQCGLWSWANQQYKQTPSETE